MVKICTLASTYDIPVIAHGHSVPANTHLTMATRSCSPRWLSIS